MNEEIQIIPVTQIKQYVRLYMCIEPIYIIHTNIPVFGISDILPVFPKEDGTDCLQNDNRFRLCDGSKVPDKLKNVLRLEYFPDFSDCFTAIFKEGSPIINALN